MKGFSLSLKAAICLLLIHTITLTSGKKDENLSPEIFDDDIEESEKAEKIADASLKYTKFSGPLKYWPVSIHDSNPNGNLRTVEKLFKKFDYERVNASNGDDWHVLWSVEYPFLPTSGKMHQLLKPMEGFTPNKVQRINHFPGIQYITDKKTLAKHSRSQFLLPTFVFPDHAENFTEFVKLQPSVTFIEKNVKSGGVRMVEASEVDTKNEKKLVQAFMDNPFLIDDHAFTMGVFVVVTSVNPLRIYRYEHDVLFRFCQKEFFPFDRYDTARYVVDGNHKSAFELPAFRQLHFKYGYSYKTIFDNMIKDQSFSVEKFWKRVDHAINSLIPQHEARIIERINATGIDSTIHFFELLRFDFLVDVDMNPYVVKVDMSPDLTPTFDRYEENAIIYEQLMYNTLKLIGAASKDDYTSRYDDDAITSNFMNIATNFEGCIENDCADECDDPKCAICMPCLKDDSMFHMHEAYREHMRRGNFKRIFPTKDHFDIKQLLAALYSKNQMMFKWFKSQCKIDKSYC